MYCLFNECIMYLFKLKVVYHNNNKKGLKSCSFCFFSPLLSAAVSSIKILIGLYLKIFLLYYNPGPDAMFLSDSGTAEHGCNVFK